MNFIGVSSSEQARRGYWRVILKGDALDLGFLLSNPLEKWPAKVDKWCAAVNAGDAKVPAVCSPPASNPGTSIVSARAIVDVHILGAELGDTVGTVARRMDALVTSVDVESVQAINNPDSIARDAALKNAAEAATDPLGFDKLYDLIRLGLLIGLVVGAVYVLAKGRELLK